MLTKEIVHSQVEEMPNEFTLDELIERLIVVEKNNRGLQDIEEGKILTEEELDKRMAKWFV